MTKHSGCEIYINDISKENLDALVSEYHAVCCCRVKQSREQSAKWVDELNKWEVTCEYDGEVYEYTVGEEAILVKDGAFAGVIISVDGGTGRPASDAGPESRYYPHSYPLLVPEVCEQKSRLVLDESNGYSKCTVYHIEKRS